LLDLEIIYLCIVNGYFTKVFANVIKERAPAIVIAHNHFTPSLQDFDVIKRFVKAGKLLGIKVY